MGEGVTSRQSTLSRRKLLGRLGLGTVAGGLIASSEAVAKPPRALQRRPTRYQAAGTPGLPPGAVIALNRMGFGPAPGDIAAFDALGGDDATRLAAYVAQQLDPDSIDDSEVETRIADANFESIDLSPDPDTYLAILWDWYTNDGAPSGNTSSSIPRDELIRVKFMRTMYSKRQLVEVMADFWHDHFNVYSSVSSHVRAPLPHFDMVVRLELLGNFRTLLESVSRSTSMLRYLDNYTSSNAGPNENFSRELFELHTLGAENYLGVLPQSEVPKDTNGIPIGYVDADVFESTRCFTGWSYSYGPDDDGDTGLFYYRFPWHDRFQKLVLGNFIPADQENLKDGRDVLDALAAHPGTGRHIARKLCRKFIADDPPQAVVDAAAAVFTAQWQAPDQIKQVLETILLSNEFLSTWGEKTKRPLEIVAGALRAGGVDWTLKMEDSDTNSLLSRFRDAGQYFFEWPAPNGYPDVRDAWKSMTPRVQGWRLVNWLIDMDDNNGGYYVDIVAETPNGVRSANELSDYWIDRILGRPMDADDRDEIVEFMAQGINPDLDFDLNDENIADRVRAMAGVLFMSPNFLFR